MKILPLFIIFAALTSCNFSENTKVATASSSEDQEVIQNPEEIKVEINNVLEEWHKAAAAAQFETYFSLMRQDAIFIGTDAGENWNMAEFKEFSKPYFDRGKAWSFSTLERNIFFEPGGQTAWFDELLDTQMGICRGSGVLTFENNIWKIKHYVLSIAIPNENVAEITILKQEHDAAIISQLQDGNSN